MTNTLDKVKHLVRRRKVRISEHGMEELQADDITLRGIFESVDTAVIAEDYPDAFKGPTVLALHMIDGKHIHVVWGLAKSAPDIATLVTAYVPNPQKWYGDFIRRRPR